MNLTTSQIETLRDHYEVMHNVLEGDARDICTATLHALNELLEYREAEEQAEEKFIPLPEPSNRVRMFIMGGAR